MSLGVSLLGIVSVRHIFVKLDLEIKMEAIFEECKKYPSLQSEVRDGEIWIVWKDERKICRSVTSLEVVQGLHDQMKAEYSKIVIQHCHCYMFFLMDSCSASQTVPLECERCQFRYFKTVGSHISHFLAPLQKEEANFLSRKIVELMVYDLPGDETRKMLTILDKLISLH